MIEWFSLYVVEDEVEAFSKELINDGCLDKLFSIGNFAQNLLKREVMNVETLSLLNYDVKKKKNFSKLGHQYGVLNEEIGRELYALIVLVQGFFDSLITMLKLYSFVSPSPFNINAELSKSVEKYLHNFYLEDIESVHVLLNYFAKLHSSSISLENETDCHTKFLYSIQGHSTSSSFLFSLSLLPLKLMLSHFDWFSSETVNIKLICNACFRNSVKLLKFDCTQTYLNKVEPLNVLLASLISRAVGEKSKTNSYNNQIEPYINIYFDNCTNHVPIICDWSYFSQFADFLNLIVLYVSTDQFEEIRVTFVKKLYDHLKSRNALGEIAKKHPILVGDTNEALRLIRETNDLTLVFYDQSNWQMLFNTLSNFFVATKKLKECLKYLVLLDAETNMYEDIYLTTLTSFSLLIKLLIIENQSGYTRINSLRLRCRRLLFAILDNLSCYCFNFDEQLTSSFFNLLLRNLILALAECKENMISRSLKLADFFITEDSYNKFLLEVVNQNDDHLIQLKMSQVCFKLLLLVLDKYYYSISKNLLNELLEQFCLGLFSSEHKLPLFLTSDSIALDFYLKNSLKLVRVENYEKMCIVGTLDNNYLEKYIDFSSLIAEFELLKDFFSRASLLLQLKTSSEPILAFNKLLIDLELTEESLGKTFVFNYFEQYVVEFYNYFCYLFSFIVDLIVIKKDYTVKAKIQAYKKSLYLVMIRNFEASLNKSSERYLDEKLNAFFAVLTFLSFFTKFTENTNTVESLQEQALKILVLLNQQKVALKKLIDLNYNSIVMRKFAARLTKFCNKQKTYKKVLSEYAIEEEGEGYVDSQNELCELSSEEDDTEIEKENDKLMVEKDLSSSNILDLDTIDECANFNSLGRSIGLRNEINNYIISFFKL